MPKSAVGHRVAFNMAKLAFASEVRHSLLSIHHELVSLANTPNRDLSQPLVGVCVCLCITFVACPWLVWRAVVAKACNYRKKRSLLQCANTCSKPLWFATSGKGFSWGSCSGMRTGEGTFRKFMTWRTYGDMLDVNTRHQLLYNDPHLEWLFMGATGAGHCFGEDFF